jgi:hypothetical protein
MALGSTPLDGPVSESLATVAAKEQTPLVAETMRQERLLGQLTEATYSLRDKLGPLLGSIPESGAKPAVDSSGSSEFIRVLADNNDRLEIVIENIKATRLALEI